MKSTLNLKFLSIYVIYGFLSLFVVGTLSSGLLSGALNRMMSESMFKQVNIMATDYMPLYFSEQITLRDVKIQLEGMEAQLDAAVWFVDRQGKMITSVDPSDYPIAPRQIRDFDPTENGNKKYQTGDYHGIFSEDVITVIAPVNYEYAIKGYLMVHKKVSRIDEWGDMIMKIIYITTIVIYALSLIFIIGIGILIFRPLRIITEAATQYASGNLDYEIPVTTQDEMGYLSASLNYMSSHLRDMEDYQKKFIANVSHDFRSPLTSIRGYVQAMSDGTIPPEFYEKYLKIILHETERLTDLTQDLLTLNEFDTKNLLLNKEHFDIHEMIKQVAASFEGTCKQKNILIELVFATKHVEVYADKRKIQQVLYNLLDNAIKFSDDGSSITIETTERGEKVNVSVKDYGMGIPRKEMNKIWERFYKSDLSRGKDKKGTGLGLAIVKEAITAHGENINVISTEGVGTEFVFTLSKWKNEP